MKRPPARPNAASPEEGGRRRAPLKSVSTRIVLCVFASTLLTALIVSWLSVGAIHEDVRSRVSQRTRLLILERAKAVDRWHARVSTQLAASAAIGTEWHDALLAALETHRTSGDLHWVSPDVPERAPGMHGPQAVLPAPPPDLAGQLGRLALRPAARMGESHGSNIGCLAVRTDLIRATGGSAGRLEACLDDGRLLALLQPPTSELRGLRLLLVDAGGHVVAGAGARANTRVGVRLPMSQLLYRGQAHGEDPLATYTDAAGTRLVGAHAPVAQAGWSVVAEAEYADAFAAAIAITNQIFVVDVCIILLFSVLAYKITLAIMQPIEALSEGAQRIAAGQIDHQIPMPANDDDELGLLTRTFNEMMRKLRSSQLEIEEDRIRLAEKNEELQRANEILAQLSITDGLTKLHNHRYFQDHLTREIKRVSRTGAPLSMILLDIDDFKQLNDTHGHAAGDEVLIALAAIMNDSARESDLIARYGGEEFVILLPNTDLAGAVHLAEKLRMAVESTRLIVGDSLKPIEITISLGVAVYHGNRRDFFAEADRALYQAKASGKNCVIIAGSDPGVPPRVA